MKDLLLIAAAVWILSRKPATPATSKPGSVPNPVARHRGMRNNNPGNLRISANAWQGKIPVSENTDGAFEQFESMFYGVRAALVNMRSHYNRGKNTVYKLVTTWAPYSDNPTDAVENYVDAVAKAAGQLRNEPFAWTERNVVNIANAMFLFENAGEGPTRQEIKNAYYAI